MDKIISHRNIVGHPSASNVFILSWADKSVKEVAEAWRARGEPDKKGDWRCPGCQAKRDAVPSGYWYSYLFLKKSLLICISNCQNSS
jgi:hypothetical protein